MECVDSLKSSYKSYPIEINNKRYWVGLYDGVYSLTEYQDGELKVLTFCSKVDILVYINKLRREYGHTN